jgi:hypothetical protein
MQLHANPVSDGDIFSISLWLGGTAPLNQSGPQHRQNTHSAKQHN